MPILSIGIGQLCSLTSVSFQVLSHSNRNAIMQKAMLVFALVLVVWTIPPRPNSTLCAQELFPATEETETDAEKRERTLASRFLTVLKRSPRVGTALDRVYGYHVGRGTLDEFCESLGELAEKDNDGTYWMILGMVQMQRGQDAIAAESLKNAEKLLPDAPLASYYLGKTQVLLGEVDAAAETMRRAIEKKPARADMLQVFKDLGRIYQRTGRNQDALKVWADLEQLFPNDLGVQEQIATILAEEGSEEAALTRFENLANRTKDRFRKVEMSIRAAQLKAKTGKTEEALDDFEKQLGVVNPDSWLHRDIRNRIEEVFWSSSDFDGLVQYYTKWTGEHPEDVDAMMRTARVLSIQKRTPEAQEWFKKAIEKAPNSTEPREALVQALATDNKYAAAAEAMGELVEIEPENPDYIVRWGELILSDSDRPIAERRKEAADVWDKLLEQRGDDAVTVARVADLKRGAELKEEAIELYRKAISLAENEPQYREYLGEYLHQLQRKDEAIEVWKQLASGSRRSRDNLVRLSEVFATFGYNDRALETMAEACEMNPNFGQRGRYAELLRKSEKYEEALAQLDLAEPLAEAPEEREIVIEERIANYQAQGNLGERIDELETALAGPQAEDSDGWRLLALYRQADRRFQPACDAIEKATELAGNDAKTWETAASLYERTGRFGEAVAAYRKLASIDRRFITNYLTQIATLEMRQGNVDEALKAGEDLLAAAPGNAESYRFYAGLCMQAGNVDRGLEVLRRNVRANPGDRDALEYLASSLAENFATDEAIELYWRSFDEANDVDSRIANIEALTELYLRTNRFDPFIDRIELTMREENKPREGTLLTAAAHQAAGDLGMARQLLEQLVREDSRDTKLLDQLVTLSKVEYDFESAIEYQKRLLALSPSPEGEYRLAKMLLDAGQLDEAEAMWMKLASRRKSGGGGMAETIEDLNNGQQFETAAAVAEKALTSEPDNWELLAPAMIAFWKSDRVDQAKEVAEQALALDIAVGELTEESKQALKRFKSRANSRPGYNMYEQLGNPMQMVEQMSRVRTALVGNTDPFSGYSSRSRMPETRCFGDVKAVARTIQLVSMDSKAEDALKEKMVGNALKSDKPEEVWDAIAMVSPTSSLAYNPTPMVESEVDKLLDRLIELEDSAAAGLVINRKFNARNREQGGAMEEEELKELLRLRELSVRGSGPARNSDYYTFWLIGELRRGGMSEEAEALLAETTDGKQEPMMLVQAAGMQMNLLRNSSADDENAKESVKMALGLIQKALEKTDAQTQNKQYIIQSLQGVIPKLVEFGEFDSAVDLMKEALHVQARLTAGMRPSQRSKSPSNPNMSYGFQVNGRYQSMQVSFPPPSGYFEPNTICSLHCLYEMARRTDKLAELKAATREWSEPAESDDAYLKFAKLMAYASILHWDGQPAAALTAISDATNLSLGTQYVSLMQARMQYDSGDVAGALETIEKLRPSNQQMLVDRELTRLSLLLQLGDLDRSRKSAEKLFALRLKSDTELQLADLMYQLGMREMADQLMARIQRRSGAKQETLSKLMDRYALADQLPKAAEIARQIIRRTSPPSGNRRTSEQAQHRSALQVLVRAGEIDSLIERHEELVKRSPKSLPLINKLAAMYEAAGRRKDAADLRVKSASKATANPANLMAAAQQLSAAGKNAEAVDMYLKLIRKEPAQFERAYNSMRGAFQQEKALPRLVDALCDIGLDKFRNNYRVGNLVYELMRYDQLEAAEKLFDNIVDSGDWYLISNAMQYISRPDAKLEISEKSATKIADIVCESAAKAGNNIQYVNSMSSTGIATGMASSVAKLISGNEKQLKRVVDALDEQVESTPEAVFPRVLLAMFQAEAKEFDKAVELVEPLMEQESRNSQTNQALWAVASVLAPKESSPESAIRILESISDMSDSAFGYGGLQFESSPQNLLVTSYENTGDKEAAKKTMVKVLEEIEIDQQQNQYNPGYGEYRFMNSLDGLARRLLKSDAPVEALIAYQRAYSDPAMMKASQRWGGNMESRKKSLDTAIRKELKGDVLVGLIEQTLTGSEENASLKYLTKATEEGEIMTKTRLRMPLEGFLSSIASDKNLKQRMDGVLDQVANKTDEDQAPEQLTELVTRLVVASNLRHDGLMATVTEDLEQWLDENAPPPKPDAPLPKPKQPAATQGSPFGGPVVRVAPQSKQPKEKNDDEKNEESREQDIMREAFEEELLLSVAARAIASNDGEADEESAESDTNDSSANPLAQKLLDRAIRAANELHRDELAFGLRVQLASQLASAQPDRSKALFMEALDDLLPQKKN